MPTIITMMVVGLLEVPQNTCLHKSRESREDVVEVLIFKWVHPVMPCFSVR